MKLTHLEKKMLAALKALVYGGVSTEQILSMCTDAIKSAVSKQSEHMYIMDPFELSEAGSPCCQSRAIIMLRCTKPPAFEMHLCLKCLSSPYKVTFEDNVPCIRVKNAYGSDSLTPCCGAPAQVHGSVVEGGSLKRDVSCPRCSKRYFISCNVEDAPTGSLPKPEVVQ